MAAHIVSVFGCLVLIGCGQQRPADLSPISNDYHPPDWQGFVEQGEAPAVSVAKAEFEKRQGKPTEARYLFGTTRTNYVVLIQPVLGYDHGQPLTDTNRQCEVVMSKQLKVIERRPR